MPRPSKYAGSDTKPKRARKPDPSQAQMPKVDDEKQKRRPLRPNRNELQSNYSPVESDVLKAVQKYKSDWHRPYPTIVEILDIIRSLGWKEPE